MSLADAFVQCTMNDDGSAEFTLSFADDDYRFSAYQEDDMAVVSYEETLTWRGEVRVSSPDDDLYKALMQSDEMTDYLDHFGLASVKRDDRHL